LILNFLKLYKNNPVFEKFDYLKDIALSYSFLLTLEGIYK